MKIKEPKGIVLFLVRHGATSANDNGLFRGNIDFPLAESGRSDARVLAEYFKDKPLSFMVSSDRQRATETADIIRKKQPDLPFDTTQQLRALNVGKFSGQPRSEENMKELQKYISQPDLQIPGGESLEQFRSRVSPTLSECFDLAIEAPYPGLIICHSSVVREVGNIVFKNQKAVAVEPGGIAILYIDSSGKPSAKALYKPLADTSASASFS